MMARAAGDVDRSPRRPSLLTAIVGAHLLAIWLLLRPGPPLPVTAPQPLLTLFDVEPPPPPPPPAPAPPPAMAKAPLTAGGGGSPGVQRQRPATLVEQPAPPRREAMDATLVPDTPPSLAGPEAGSAPIDLGLGGLNGRGDGTGSGDGPGDGPGRGAGGSDQDAYAAAEWIERPPPGLAKRYWPIGQEKLRQPVTVRLACRVRRNGRPYACRVRSETPRHLGFSRTALAILQAARVRPVTRNGNPVPDIPVLISIVFDRLEAAPRVPITSAASAPPVR